MKTKIFTLTGILMAAGLALVIVGCILDVESIKIAGVVTLSVCFAAGSAALKIAKKSKSETKCTFAEEIIRQYKASQEIRTVDEIVPEMSMNEAGELAGNCDYAFAVSDVRDKDPDVPDVNWADAESFYLAGYEEARKRLKTAKVLLLVIPELKQTRTTSDKAI